MFLIKKLYPILFALGIVLSIGTIPAHAEDIDDSVKNYYEKPDESPKKDESIEGSPKEEALPSNNVGLSFWDFFRMIFALGFVIALLYVLLRFIGKKSRAYQKANFIENLGGTNLGNNRSVQLVKVGEKILVVGVGENIQLLAEITDKVEQEKLLQEYNEKYNQVMDSSNLIEKFKSLGKLTKTNQSFSSEFKSKLDEIKTNRQQLMKKLDEKGRDDE